jgi:hypothetical protein
MMPNFVFAGEEWDTKLDIQTSYGSYSNSEQRKDKWSTGLYITADYLDTIGFTVGYNRTGINYQQGINSLEQNAYYVSIKKYFTPDILPGKFTFRIDGHYIDNNDPTNNSDEGKIIAPQISYLAFDKSHYFDLGFAYSNYADMPQFNIGSLNIYQWTPTFGFGFNQNYDWLQLRGYFIHSSNSLRTHGLNGTIAVEGKLIHYFKPDAFSSIDRLQLILLVGQRTYAVDSDTGSVYNLSDIQKGSVSFEGTWELTKNWSLTLNSGVEQFENKNSNDKYYHPYGFLNISKTW